MAKNGDSNTDTRNILPFSSNGRKIYVLSDLHLASGLNKSGNYEGTENFYADHSFVRFINHLQENLGNTTAVLVINGDFIDFLRICEYPSSPDDFLLWQTLLKNSGISKSINELEDSIASKEKEYGLKTHDYKTIWKLHTCSEGHKSMFLRLAKWLKDGNELVIVKGNHDLEWYLGENKWYFNTGTWIPIFETSSAEVRQDKTYTFITVDFNEKYPCRERLQRWNDDALRIDPMNLNDKK